MYSNRQAFDSTPHISVVVPLFNEQENLDELYRRLSEALTGLWVSYELVLVNDGSTDATTAMLDRLTAADPRVVAVHLSRNFGHQAAISAGLDLARGQAVVILDGDLQDPPEVLDQFIAAWREGYEVVYAVRTRRKENPLKRAGYAIFYRLLRAVSDVHIPLDSGDFCLLDRTVVDVIKRLPEKTRFVRGLRSFVGFRQVGIRYERAARLAGKPKYTLGSLCRLAVDGLISFSRFPLTLVTCFGLIAAGVAVVLAGWIAMRALVYQEAPSAWAVVIAVVMVMSAVQLLSLGIIGEYVRRIFVETKGRPSYIVREVRQQPATESDDHATAARRVA